MAQQNKQSLLIYGAATAVIAALSIGFVYYIVEDDRKVQRRKTARRAERNTLRLLSQIEQQQGAIASSISSVEPIIELECDDKAFKQKEYTLAHSNELLLRLMEQLDAVRPLTLIVGQDLEPTEFERQLVDKLKNKKRSVIDSINELFRRLDICNERVKKEAAKREEVAKEKARLEREEKERLAREEEERKKAEEEERKRIEEEKAQQAREEQERVAKEEALRRMREEEEQAAQEAISKETDNHDDDKSFEEIQSNGQVEVSYIELNETQEE